MIALACFALTGRVGFCFNSTSLWREPIQDRCIEPIGVYRQVQSPTGYWTSVGREGVLLRDARMARLNFAPVTMRLPDASSAVACHYPFGLLPYELKLGRMTAQSISVARGQVKSTGRTAEHGNGFRRLPVG